MRFLDYARNDKKKESHLIGWDLFYPAIYLP